MPPEDLLRFQLDRPTQLLRRVEVVESGDVDRPEKRRVITTRNATQLTRLNELIAPIGAAEVHLRPFPNGEPLPGVATDMMRIEERYRCSQPVEQDATDPFGRVVLRNVNFPGERLRAGVTSKPFYLFNVLVAFEWRPTRVVLDQLRAATTAASTFLFDVTDGYMAIGQVIVGGRRYLPAADIQIMASTRFLPRSWVDGLHDPKKYSPVRLGRGLWSKQNHVVTSWEEPDGYRTMVHEWCHYALNLVDEYLNQRVLCKPDNPARPTRLIEAQRDDAEFTLVVPRVSVALDTIMATLAASEIVPQHRGPNFTKIQRRISENYPGVVVAETADPGPRQLPIPVPYFYELWPFESEEETTADGRRYDFVATSRADARDGDLTTYDEWWLDLAPLQNLERRHCWLYTLRLDGDQLVRVVAQGMIDGRAWPLDDSDPDSRLLQKDTGFGLLGVTPGDHLLLVGWERAQVGSAAPLAVRLGALEYSNVGGRLAAPGLADALPRNGDNQPATPVVSVIPDHTTQGSKDWTCLPVKVRILGGRKPSSVWLAPPGVQPKLLEIDEEKTVAGRACWETKVWDPGHLDGVVVLRWDALPDDQRQFAGRASYWVAEYSHGGGPPTNVGHAPAPFSAGSSEGNLLVYGHKEEREDYSTVRIVTTRNYGEAAPGPAGRSPESYLFSLAANGHIPSQAVPTAVFSYDRYADNEIGVFRFDEAQAGWRRIPAFLPHGLSVAAFPLVRAYAPRLANERSRAPSRVEHYQLFGAAPVRPAAGRPRQPNA